MPIPDQRCGATTRSGGECKQIAMENGRCRMHGGKSTGAPIKHGRYCNVLPTQLADFYESARKDKDLLSLREEAALLQTFILDGVAALDMNQCQAAWDTLEVLSKEAYGSDPEERGEIALRMAETIKDGVEVWKQIGRVLGYVDQKRSLADTESKRIKAQAETMTAKEALALVSYVADAVRSEFADQPHRVARVTAKLAVVVGGKADEPSLRVA